MFGPKKLNDFSLTLLTTLGLLGASLAAAGCGPQVYKRATLVDGQNAPGEFTIPAKVDILFAEDDSGSLAEAYSAIQKEIPKFLAGLETSGWDYHFATVPLTTPRSITQILTSRHDANYYGLNQWIAPFPGANPYSPDLAVDPAFFRMPGYYSDFIASGDLDNEQGAYEPGIETAINILSEPNSTSSGFLRGDALLVVIFMSNGEDTTGAYSCVRSDGYADYCGATELSVLRDQLVGIKGAQERLRVYSAVSPYTSHLSGGTLCLGAKARSGDRYKQFSESLGGQAYDICSQPISSVLGGMSQHLREQRLEFVSRYIVLENEPDFNQPVTVSVLRGGTTREKIFHISDDPVNGWEYVGFQSNVPLIEYPVPMNETSGYMIRLNGDSALRGKDKPEVEYKPAGTSDSHT